MACGASTRCDAALRPRGRAARGPREAQVARTRGMRPRGSTRMPVRGATWLSGGWHLEGPRVSGPWLGVWGGNANALPCPSLYTYNFFVFIPCGTMFPWNHSFAGDVAASRASNPIVRRRSCGPESTRSKSEHVCQS